MKSVRTAEHLCYQWGAVTCLIMNKKANVPEYLFHAKATSLKFRIPGLSEEIKAIAPKYEHMNIDDIFLYFHCIESLIEEILTENTFATIFNTTITTLYESAYQSVFISTPRAQAQERSLLTPEIYFPDNIFLFIEDCLCWIKKLLEKMDHHMYSRISTDTHGIFFDFLLHNPNINLPERYDGEILSLLSIDQNWNKIVSERIRYIAASAKNSANRKSLVLLLKSLGQIRFDFTVASNRSHISETLIDWANFAMKTSDEELSSQLFTFVVCTMIACKWDPTYQQDSNMRDTLKKLIDIAFKQVKSHKYDIPSLDLAIRTVSLLNVSNFDSYFKKIWGLVEDHFKKQVCADSFKSLTLLVQLYCPNFINGEQLMRHILELIYEKSKTFTLAKRCEPYLNEIRDLFIAFSQIEPDVVCNMLINLEKCVIQTNETGPRAQFMLDLLSNVKTSNDGALKGLLASVEPKIDLYLSVASPTGIIKSSLSLIALFWTLIPRARPQISHTAQNLAEHPDPTIATLCFSAFVDMMNKAPPEDFPVNIALTMPTPILKQFDTRIRPEAFVEKINILTSFITALLHIFHNKPPESYVQWESLNKRIDEALFPFLFSPDASVVRGVRRLYNVIAADANFYSVAAWIASNKGKRLETCIAEAVTMRPDWFNDISNSAVVFWRQLDHNTQSDFGMNLAAPLCSILTPTTSNISGFFSDLLNLFLKADIRLLDSVLNTLPTAVWGQFFTEFNKFYEAHYDDQRFLCLSIQMQFLSNRLFPSFTQYRDTFYLTLQRYITSKRARFEREIPYEILSLNICNTIIRVDKTMIPKLITDVGGEAKLLKQHMQRINPKELFVVNVNRLFAHVDFFAAVLSQIKVDSNDIISVLSYLLTIADKSMEYPELLTAIAECVNQLFSHNEDSRSIIIHTALSFKNTLLNEIGTAILMNSQSDLRVTDRKQLTSELVLAMSLLSSVSNMTHTIGVQLAKTALELLANDDEEVTDAFKNPLFVYDPHAESILYHLMTKYLNDDEMEEFMTLLSSVADNIPRRSQQPYYTSKALGVFSNGTLDDFSVIFAYLAANTFHDFLAINPILDASDEMFQKDGIDLIPILQSFLDKADANKNALNAAVYLFQSAFKSKPQEVISFLKQKLGFLQALNEQQTWDNVKSNKQEYIKISTILSFILARNNDKELTRELFGDIAPQLLLFALHIFEMEEFHTDLFPPLLLSLLHSFSPSRHLSQFRFSGKGLSPTQCQYANDVIEEFDPNMAEEFRRIIIPSRADGQEMNLNFVYAIAPRFNAHDIARLLSVVASYAEKDNVGTVLRFLPFLCNALPSVAPPRTIAYFILFLVSFMFDNGDPRITIAVTEQLPVIASLLDSHGTRSQVAEELSQLVLNNGGIDMLLSVVLEPLVLTDSLTSPLYAACVDFLINFVDLMNAGEEKPLSPVDIVIIILDALWNLSGIRGRLYKTRKTGWVTGCPSVAELSKFVSSALTTEQDKKSVVQFLLQLASKMVVQDEKFRLNAATLFCQLVNDIELIANLENVGAFLLVSSVCTEKYIATKYSELLGQLIKTERDLPKQAYDFLYVFGPTLVHNDPDSLEIVRTISPDFYPEHSVISRPPAIESFISELTLQ